MTLVSRTALGYAVSRAHHADVGGMEPASLPAFSRELYQEGLIIPPVRLTDEVLTLFVANARNPQERRGDLRAQMAAHRLAERRIDELCARRGRERVVAAMDELYAYSERMVRAAIARLPDGRWSAEDVVEAVEGDLHHPLHRRGARRRDPHRLRRHRGRSIRAISTARSRSRGRPATSSCAVSRSRICRHPAARSRRCTSPRRRAASSTRVRLPRSSRATRRRRRASSTSSSARSAKRCRCLRRGRGR